MKTAESQRLECPRYHHIQPWKKWGPYVSERAWGTVREDYSAGGDAWNFLPHDQARSKAYRWGEDGLAGFCDQFQLVIFSLAFWNGQDPILKERLFGLNSDEGNHGEDVKEYYYYLDATPTYSYCKYLYKYPQKAYPYDSLVQTNQHRSAFDYEFELIDTGIFDENRYFDVYIEYAKADAEDICIRIEVCNRGPDAATIHLLPHLWFRNTWSWSPTLGAIPTIEEGPKGKDFISLCADPSILPSPTHLSFDYRLRPLYLYADTGAIPLFTNNESNNTKLWGSKSANRTPYVKDAFHRYIINQETCVNPEKQGSKACLHYKELNIPAGGSYALHLRLTPELLDNPLSDVEQVIKQRKQEADAYYAEIQSPSLSEDDKNIQRQAFAGMLWTKQFYFYDVNTWFNGDNPAFPPPESRKNIRNMHWKHLHSNNLFSMPDKWEYPWFAAWDLAFHTLVFSLIDHESAKMQFSTLLMHQHQHPNGQIPAYEWAFSDLNPPVQAWTLWHLYQREVEQQQKGDRTFLESGFLKLVNNFAWWVNKVDRCGNNFFEGGFLGLDNISVIDRSKPIPSGGHLEQSDGTGWMGFFSLYMMRIALELAKEEKTYETMATIYFEHFVYIAAAMQSLKYRQISMWDEQDKFFYDVLSYPDGSHQSLKIRSFVGIIPFFSIGFFDEEELIHFPTFHENMELFTRNNPDLVSRCMTPFTNGGKQRYLLSLMRPDQIEAILKRVWDPNEFRSPYGLRSLSKYHEQHPLSFNESQVGYEPGESKERIKGGNSNWRGPIWLPINFITLEALRTLSEVVGEQMKIEVSGEAAVTVKAIESQLAQNLINLFRKNNQGKRPIHQKEPIYAENRHWQDLVLFYEHYHGDNGRGLGASHQTGWSGLVANLIERYGSENANKST